MLPSPCLQPSIPYSPRAPSWSPLSLSCLSFSHQLWLDLGLSHHSPPSTLLFPTSTVHLTALMYSLQEGVLDLTTTVPACPCTHTRTRTRTCTRTCTSLGSLLLCVLMHESACFIFLFLSRQYHNSTCSSVPSSGQALWAYNLCGCLWGHVWKDPTLGGIFHGCLPEICYNFWIRDSIFILCWMPISLCTDQAVSPARAGTRSDLFTSGSQST